MCFKRGVDRRSTSSASKTSWPCAHVSIKRAVACDIALIGGPQTTNVAVERERGYHRALAECGLSEMPTLEQLSADVRKSDLEYIDYVSSLDRDQLAERIDFTFTDGATGRMSREEMLMHVITHGVGHRGQVSAVMLLNSVSPAKDGFTTYLHEAEGSARGRAAACSTTSTLLRRQARAQVGRIGR